MFIENNHILVISRIAFWVFVVTLVSTLFAQFVLPEVCDGQTYYDVTVGMNDTYCDESTLGGVVDAVLAVPARLIPISLFVMIMAFMGVYSLFSGDIIIYTHQTTVWPTIVTILLGLLSLVFYVLVLIYAVSLLERGIETVQEWRKK